MQTQQALTPTLHASPPLVDIDQDDDDFCAPPVRRIVPAAQAQALTGLGPASVFTMADAAKAAKALKAGGRFGSAGGFEPAPPYAGNATVTREGGVTRCTGAQYPANRWDAEREEQERQRRARQKPPRPTKKAKSRGRKVRVWDGEDVG